MLEHCNVIGVILDRSDVGNRQAVLILDRPIESDPRVRLRQILSTGPDRDHVVVLLEQIGDFAAPTSGHDAERGEGESDVEDLQMIAPREASRGIVAGLAAHDRRRVNAPVRMDRPIKGRVHMLGGMAHVVSSDLTRRVSHTVFEHVRS